MLVYRVVGAVIQKVHKIRHYRLSALVFKKIDKSVVCERHILYEYLADYADSRLDDALVELEAVKISDYSLAYRLVAIH